MPKTLHGSCHCTGVQFTLQSSTPVPYQLCACSMCRKCGGYGGSVNLGGIANTLEVTKGKDLIKKYQALKHPLNNDPSTNQPAKHNSFRSFCSICSTMLWLWDPTWPELIHPFASAIDTELEVPDEMVCVKGDSKPAYVRWVEGKKSVFEEYGGKSLEEWHKEKGVWVE